MEHIRSAAELVHREDFKTFENLFRLEYSSVYRTALRLLGNTGRAEEIAAEVFLKVLERQSLIQSESISGWLHRSAINAALDDLRKQKRHSRVLMVDEPIGHGELDPHEAIVRADKAARVRAVLTTMRPRDVRLLIALSGGLTYEETAEIAGVRKSSVGTQIARAKSLFAERYVRRYGND